MASGACNCGAISFEINTDISDVVICHCSICRRATGSNGIAVLVVDTERFEWTSGKAFVTSWKKPDSDWEMSAGLISDGGENLRVAHHIFVSSKATWDEIGDGGHRHPEAFEG